MNSRLRFPYVGGEMALGISTPAMVIALGQTGMLGFLGTAGLGSEEVERRCREVQKQLDPQRLPWGVNLIHSPQEPQQEERLANLFLGLGITRVSISAFMKLTPTIVHYASKGLARAPDGIITRKHYLFAKISRPEMAERFIAPSPDNLLGPLVPRAASPGKRRNSPPNCRFAKTSPWNPIPVAIPTSGPWHRCFPPSPNYATARQRALALVHPCVWVWREGSAHLTRSPPLLPWAPPTCW